MLTEPAVDVTGDAMLAQELLNDLRAAQAKLEAAREDAASLKVLLALRTHQHDLAWQEAQRLAAELENARTRSSALEAERAEG
ncbi:atp-dependent helicase, partial [Methylobacterium sp. WL18]